MEGRLLNTSLPYYFIILVAIFCIVIIFNEFQHANANADLEQMPQEVKNLFNLSGLILHEVNSNISKDFGVSEPFGLLVTDVIDSSPSDLADIQNNDLIIDINFVNGSIYGCDKGLLNEPRSGPVLKLTILRQNESLDRCVDILTTRTNNSDYSLKFKDPAGLTFSKYSSNSFEIHYPADWKKVVLNNTERGIDGVKFNFFSNNANDSLDGYVMISVMEKKDQSNSFSQNSKNFSDWSNIELIDTIISNFSNPDSVRGYNAWTGYSYNRGNMENVENIENAREQQLSLNSKSVNLTNFSLITQVGKLEILKCMIIGKSQILTFYFVIREDHFEDYLPTIAEMLMSLKFHDMKRYLDLDNKFEISYPSDEFRIDETKSFYQTVKFSKHAANDTSNIDHKFPRLTLETFITYGGDSNISKNDEGNLINLLKGRYLNYSTLGSNITNDILNATTLRLDFSYYDLLYGPISGTVLYAEFNDRMFRFFYEDQQEKYQNTSASLLNIVNSFRMIESQPYLDPEKGLYVYHPSTWKIISNESNETRFSLSNNLNSNLTIEVVKPEFNIANSINGTETITNQKKSQGCKIVSFPSLNVRNLSPFSDYIQPYVQPYYSIHYTCSKSDTNIIALEIGFLDDSKTKLYNFSYVANNPYEYDNNLNLTLDTLEEKTILNFQNNSFDTMEKLNSSQKIPFEINYDPKLWNYSTSINGGFVSSFIEFTTGTSNIRISYWNDLDASMVDDQMYYDQMYMSSANSFKTNITDLHIRGPNDSILNGSAILYFDTVKNHVSLVFYGQDGNHGNYRIEYVGHISVYLQFWKDAMRMIESIKINDDIKRVDPNGIPVKNQPMGIIYNEKEKVIFVANQISKTISVLDATNYKVISEIGLNTTTGPFDLVYNDNRNALYVVHHNGIDLGGLTKITFDHDASKNTNFAKPQPPTPMIRESKLIPGDVVVNKDKVFVADVYDNRLIIIDDRGKKNNTIDYINLGNKPDCYKDKDKPSKELCARQTGMSLTLDDSNNMLYIANPINNAIQIFDTIKNRIVDNIQTLDKRSCPIDISRDIINNRLYVLDISNYCVFGYNPDNGSLLVIDALSKEIIKKIKVGVSPNNVAVDQKTHKIFVTNQLSDSLTIVDPITFNPHTINELGISPFGVTVDSNNGLAFITSTAAHSVIIFNEEKNKIVHGVTFNNNSDKSGFITCENNNILFNRMNHIVDETTCKVEPKPGFVFHSWTNEWGDSMPILDSNPGSSWIEKIYQPVLNALGFQGPSYIPIKTSGSYTMNFVDSPVLVPKEQLTGLYLLAAGLFSTWLIPNLSRWINSGRKSKLQTKAFASFLSKIEALDVHTDEKTIKDLRKLINNTLSDGKITENQYSILDKKIIERVNGPK